MRLTQKKIEEILINILGSEGAPLLKHLYGKENISEFELATKTRRDIKNIRKMLYILYNYNLVGFTRKKDKQKGWYVYYWTLLPESIKFNYIKNRRELLSLLKQRLEEENKELFFTCLNNCVRLNFDQAMDLEFHCPECGELLTQDNGEEKIRLLTAQIKEIKAELEAIEQKRAIRKAAKKKREKKINLKRTGKTKEKKAGFKGATAKKRETFSKKSIKKAKPIRKLKK